MINEKQDTVLARALLKYGIDQQFNMVTEEAGELLQAMNKLRRKMPLTGNVLVEPNLESPIEYCLAFYNLCGEVADMKIMLRQIELAMGFAGEAAVGLAIERKIERLNERLTKHA
jgi:NTP pyrophosphatase (non-canonical NTP hydrolase)